MCELVWGELGTFVKKRRGKSKGGRGIRANKSAERV